MNSTPPPPGALAAAQTLFPYGRAHYSYSTREMNDAAMLADQTSAAQVIAAHTRADLLDLLRAVEADHFRTTHDTGANGCALTVWNALRRHAGLPLIRCVEDLPSWDGQKYVMPPGSKLLTNPAAGGTVEP